MADGRQPEVLRRIGLIGDVHGEHAALAAAIAFLKAQPDLDALLCTGDVPGKKGEGDSDLCAVHLAHAGVLTVRGNHDRWALCEKDEAHGEYSGTDIYATFARALPSYRSLQLACGLAMLCHGVGGNDMDGIYPGGNENDVIAALHVRRIYGQYRIMLCGHTHRRLVYTYGTVTVINAGTLQRDNHPCFSVVDFETGDVRFYNIEPDTLTITLADAFRFMES